MRAGRSYSPRSAAAIVEAHLAGIARAVGRGCTLIDLGAGDCSKAARMFGALQLTEYVPVDISIEFLCDAVDCLRERFPQIKMTGVGMDFSSTLDLPDATRYGARSACFFILAHLSAMRVLLSEDA